MGFQGGMVRNVLVPMAKKIVKGLFADPLGEAPGNLKYQDFLQFDLSTGSSDLSDITAVPGATTVILDSSWNPNGTWNIYVTDVRVAVMGVTAWAGGVAATVSISLQDTAGNNIVTLTQAALGASVVGVLPFFGVLPTGWTDYTVAPMKNTGAVGVGLRVAVANSTSGSPVRIRVRGYISPN